VDSRPSALRSLVRASPPLRKAWALLRSLLDKRLADGPLHYNQDGLATRQHCDFMFDPRFLRAYALGEATGSWGETRVHWRAYVACWAAHQASLLPGDFVECGVNRGGLARTIIDFVDANWTKRRFFLLDTFHGLVDDQISDEDRSVGRRAGGYDECFDAVRATFSPFSFVRLVRGVVPHTLAQVDSERVAYLSLDMNCVPPEIAAARHFWPRLVPGAIMLLDDYGFEGHEPQRRAFDAFAREHGVLILPLPTGQGVIIKP
jgi:hypothetical protein